MVLLVGHIILESKIDIIVLAGVIAGVVAKIILESKIDIVVLPGVVVQVVTEICHIV